MSAYFRLTENTDPEERLEEAALWKAMADVFGPALQPTTDGRSRPGDLVYGRALRHGGEATPDLPYWTDQAFLDYAGREFAVCCWEEADARVKALHARGVGAFVKSTLPKHAIFRVPVGEALADVVADMAYSFMDGGPRLMVQELAEVRYEHRFFVVGRRIVTHSPNAVHLTPLDHPQIYSFETPQSPTKSMFTASGFLSAVAEDVARYMATPDAVVDCALINGRPGCVEINPLIVGGVGLFASDVRALAMAIYARDWPRLKA